MSWARRGGCISQIPTHTPMQVSEEVKRLPTCRASKNGCNVEIVPGWQGASKHKIDLWQCWITAWLRMLFVTIEFLRPELVTSCPPASPPARPPARLSVCLSVCLSAWPHFCSFAVDGSRLFGDHRRLSGSHWQSPAAHPSGATWALFCWRTPMADRSANTAAHYGGQIFGVMECGYLIDWRYIAPIRSGIGILVFITIRNSVFGASLPLGTFGPGEYSWREIAVGSSADPCGIPRDHPQLNGLLDGF